MKWVNKPSKEVLATSARMHQKICAIIICATIILAAVFL